MCLKTTLYRRVALDTWNAIDIAQALSKPSEMERNRRHAYYTAGEIFYQMAIFKVRLDLRRLERFSGDQAKQDPLH